MANLELKHIKKIYENNVQAVHDFNLKIQDQEFIVFVGPSGCGKSTTLRMIAGLEEITSGEFYMDGKKMNDAAPKDRDIAMVFQSYALYPHMSVYENMAFGLKKKKLSKEEIDERIRNAAKILEIEPYLDRKPKSLSGGQRQRAALGRAIVRNAKLFLMDEPLSNLDAKLRVQMRSEIIKLHERLKATTIYVTHDQTEAMTMASRIVVMKEGYIQQIGTPSEIYNDPANMFVASFVGAPAANFLHVSVKDGKIILGTHEFMIPDRWMQALKPYEEKNIILGIRPEDIEIQETNSSDHLHYSIEVCELLGHEVLLHGQLEGQEIIVKTAAKNNLKAHSDVSVSFDLEKIHFFDAETENRIDE